MKEDSIIKGLWLAILFDSNLRVIDSLASIRPSSSSRNLEVVETKGAATKKGLIGGEKRVG